MINDQATRPQNSGIDFAALFRQQFGHDIPEPPDRVRLAGRAEPSEPPDFRHCSPLQALLREQDIDLTYQTGRQYWCFRGHMEISKELQLWLRQFAAGQPAPDIEVYFHWPKGPEPGAVTIRPVRD